MNESVAGWGDAKASPDPRPRPSGEGAEARFRLVSRPTRFEHHRYVGDKRTQRGDDACCEKLRLQPHTLEPTTDKGLSQSRDRAVAADITGRELSD